MSDTRVGPGRHDVMHAISGGGGEPGAPPLVWIPGYCTGGGLVYRIFDGLTAGLRVLAVDPLGTGLSGAWCEQHSAV
jgi:pimeloyl-ACP methyl ester carboxylesterase